MDVAHSGNTRLGDVLWGVGGRRRSNSAAKPDQERSSAGHLFPRLPLLPKWDLHFEWTSSTSPGRALFQNHGNLNYWNLDYTGGYTNNGNLMGNTVGREGVTLQAWTRYWMSPRQNLDFSWKQSRVLKDYIPGRGKVARLPNELLVHVAIGYLSEKSFAIRAHIVVSATVSRLAKQRDCFD